MIFINRGNPSYNWRGLHRLKVYCNGEWRQLKPTDKMYVNGQWVELGNTENMEIYVYNSGMDGVDGPYYKDYVGTIGRPGGGNIQGQHYKNPSGAKLGPLFASADVLEWCITVNNVICYKMPRPTYGGTISEFESFYFSALRMYFDKKYGVGNSKAYFI